MKPTPNFSGATAALPNDLAQASDFDIFSSAAAASISRSRSLVNSTPSKSIFSVRRLDVKDPHDAVAARGRTDRVIRTVHGGAEKFRGGGGFGRLEGGGRCGRGRRLGRLGRLGRLLRECGERPCCRAANHRADEISPSHRCPPIPGGVIVAANRRPGRGMGDFGHPSLGTSGPLGGLSPRSSRGDREASKTGVVGGRKAPDSCIQATTTGVQSPRGRGNRR